MAFTRTRVWRSGELGVAIGEAPAPEPEPGAPEPSSGPHTPAPSAPDPGVASRTAPRGSGSPADSELSPGLAATRFMPIEQLFPEQHTAIEGDVMAHAAWPDASTAGRTDPREGSPGQNTDARRAAGSARWRKSKIALAAAIFAVLGAKLTVLAVRQDRAAIAREPLATSPQPSEAQAPEVQPRPEPAPAEPQPRAARGGAGAPAGLERKAIDALIAGDFAGAERIYAELASDPGAPGAIAEALRILSARNIQPSAP